MNEHSLACSEVWGGNQDVLSAVSMPGLDAYVLSKPHAGDAAGGDIHYLSSCATGRIGRVLIADVAGHGEQVASLALKLRGILRKNVNYVDQSRFMRQMNREFAAALLARVRAYAQSDLDDDATIMLLKLNTIPPVRGSLAKGLETTARLAKEFARPSSHEPALHGQKCERTICWGRTSIGLTRSDEVTK